MWALLPRDWQVYVITIVAIVASSIIVAIGGGSAILSISLAATMVVVILFVAGLVWRRLWALVPWIARHTFPDLSGIWEGQLESDWIDPQNQEPLPPIPTKIVISQGLFETSVRLQTGTSASHSNRVILEPNYPAATFRVWYTYRNTPNAMAQRVSMEHDGVAFLEWDANEPDKLQGQYFTNRKTKGDIRVRKGREGGGSIS